jgi:hypothetical protein
MMRIALKLLLCAVLMVAVVLPLLLPTESRADFYKYKDNSGALIITNRFEDVPKKYRKRVKVVWDADLAAKDPVARQKAAAMEQYERQEAAKKAQQATEEKKNLSQKGKTLVIELDENTGQVIRRFE